DEYRAKWNLPSDYPMVAPNYAVSRSLLAKKFGLGLKPQEAKKSAAKKQSRAKRS
ncbi:MAG: MucR family transcriptional regulator, partial [Mesorhizobium sp.]